MLRFGMWNTRKKDVAGLVVELAREQKLDVIVLLELGVSVATLLESLAVATSELWDTPWNIESDRVRLLTRFPAALVKPIEESNRFVVWSIRRPGAPSILLAAAHLRSPMHQTPASQAFGARELAEAIASAERKENHARTVLVGDFNMDPYHDGMLATGGLHAMMSSRTVLKVTRTVDSREYPMFYNPMWAFLGDRPTGPPGSYRYWSAQHVCPEWHLFDQVLLRPSLIPSFPLSQVRILDGIAGKSLVSKTGIPNVSDHLPLVFQLNKPEVS